MEGFKGLLRFGGGRSRESGVGDRKSEVGSRKSEVGSWKLEVGSWKSGIGFHLIFLDSRLRGNDAGAYS